MRKRKHRVRRARRHAINPSRRRRRRNPFAVKGIIGDLTAGVKDAGGILLGEFGTNEIVAQVLPASMAGPVMTPVAKVASAVGVGLLVKKFLGSRLGEMALAGGIATVLRGVLKGMNIPIVSAALGDDAVTSYIPAAGAYPALTAGVAAYPSMQGMGDVGDLDLAYGATGGNY